MIAFYEVLARLDDPSVRFIEELELLEQRFQSVIRDNPISRGSIAVYGDRGRLHGPALGTRLTRTA